MGSLPCLRSRRTATVAVTVLFALVGTAHKASAGDGVGDFFSSIFGGGQAQQAPSVAPSGSAEEIGGAPQVRRRASNGRDGSSRPLTVKLHRPKIVHVARGAAAPGRVSIFEDRTLRRGDAVMTTKGMRVFAGSSNWPYREDDFVAVSNAGRMDRTLQKTLISLDQLPRQ